MDVAITCAPFCTNIANADRVASITTTAAGVTVATQTYTHNARNQITKERVQNGAPATTWERDYTYTASGLRTKIDDLQEQWGSSFQHDPAGRLSLIQTTDNSGGGKSNPFPWWEGDTRVSTSPNGDVVSMVSGANRIAYRYDEEHRLVEAQMASGDPVAVTYDGMGNLVSIVQGATTQKTLSFQGRVLQTRNASDVLQDRLFWAGPNLMRVNLDASARNQAWDARGSNNLSYQTDGTMDKARMWDAWGLEVFAAGAGSAPDVGFLSAFDLAASGLSITPSNNAWWAELGRSVEGGWRPRFQLAPGGPGGGPCIDCTDEEEGHSDSDGDNLSSCEGVCGGIVTELEGMVCTKCLYNHLVYCCKPTEGGGRVCIVLGLFATLECQACMASKGLDTTDQGSACWPGEVPGPDVGPERPEDPLMSCYWDFRNTNDQCWKDNADNIAALDLCLGEAYEDFQSCAIDATP